MASKQSTVDHLVEQMGDGVYAKKMFGEYCLFSEGIMFALVCDDQLFFKQTNAGREFIGEDVEEAPPYPGAKNAFLIGGDRWEDAKWLRELVRISVEELPPPKAKPAKATTKAKKTKPSTTPKGPKAKGR